MKIVAFDLEIAEEFPESGIVDHSALGISCAATLKAGTGSENVVLWYEDRAEGMHGPRMFADRCRALVASLLNYESAGYRIVTWNGHFDFRVIAHECKSSSYYQMCQGLALRMIDPMFQFLTQEGYCIGLEKASLGMGGESKKEGIHGELAPVLWKESREAQNKVLSYVAGDVELTADLFRKIEERKELCRVTTSGNIACVPFPKLLDVEECLKAPQAETPWWSTNPWTVGGPQDRDHIVAWAIDKHVDSVV